MAYKQSPFPMMKGTKPHLQALQASSDSPLKWVWLANLAKAAGAAIKAGAAKVAGKTALSASKVATKFGAKKLGTTLATKGTKLMGKHATQKVIQKQAWKSAFGGVSKGTKGKSFISTAGKSWPAKADSTRLTGMMKSSTQYMGEGAKGLNTAVTPNISKGKQLWNKVKTGETGVQKSYKKHGKNIHATIDHMGQLDKGGQEQQQVDIAGKFSDIDFASKNPATPETRKITPLTFQARMGRAWGSLEDQLASNKLRRRAAMQAMAGNKGVSPLGIFKGSTRAGTAKGNPTTLGTGAYG